MRRGRNFNNEAMHESQWMNVERTSAYATVTQDRMYPWTTLSNAFAIYRLDLRVHAGIISGKVYSPRLGDITRNSTALSSPTSPLDRLSEVVRCKHD